MQTNNSTDLRRWERQPTTIQISLVLKAEDDKVDNSASVIDFSLCGVGVLTTLLSKIIASPVRRHCRERL